ncbi:MAG: hypothetical protein QXW80_05745 [Candidatus Micrarchaeia archaeon]
MKVHIEGKEHTVASITIEHLSILALGEVRIKKFNGNGAFDQGPLFDNLLLLHIKPVIKIRKNVSTDYYNGSKCRRSIVREYKNLGYEI